MSSSSRPRCVGRQTRRGDAEQLCVLAVQSLPPSQLHRVASDDAPNGLTAEKPVQHVEADVPPRSAHRNVATIDVVPEGETGAGSSPRLQLPADVLSSPTEFEHPG